MAIGRVIEVSVLLDTHVLYWWMTASNRILEAHRLLINDPDEIVYVSAVTAWEMSIKAKLGKWPGAGILLPTLEEAILAEGFETLDITFAQAKFAGSLDLIHKDPFDRLIAAQSILLDIPVATLDPALAILDCKTV